jgi:hypothetical protein
MHDRNIYNETWKIPAARQQFSVRGNSPVNCAAAQLRGSIAPEENNSHQGYTNPGRSAD